MRSGAGGAPLAVAVKQAYLGRQQQQSGTDRMAANTAKELGSAGAYVLEDQVGHLLRRAHQRASAIFQDHMTDDLTPQQYAALIKVRDFGSVSQNRLGRAVAMDPATSQGVVQRLIAKRLIQRGDDPKDRRRSLLSLTAATRAAN